jgi:hypothetical protein
MHPMSAERMETHKSADSMHQVPTELVLTCYSKHTVVAHTSFNIYIFMTLAGLHRNLHNGYICWSLSPCVKPMKACLPAYLDDWLALHAGFLHSWGEVKAACVEHMHGLAQQVGLVGFGQSVLNLLHLACVVLVQLLQVTRT